MASAARRKNLLRTSFFIDAKNTEQFYLFFFFNAEISNFLANLEASMSLYKQFIDAFRT